MMKRMLAIGWTLLFLTLLVSCMKNDRDNIGLAAIGIEDCEWQLLEVGGIPVSPLTGDRRPFLKFDAEKKQASGFAGCNNFFGNYEHDGSSLKFGPVGSTRMFCPDLQMSLETEVFKALDMTRAWKIMDGDLLLLDDSEVLARFAIDRKDDPTLDLQAMTFLSSWFPSGKVTLSRGEYRNPSAPGSAADIVVTLSDKKTFGLIKAKETGAVVLVTETGGSGTFYDLALLSREAEGWVNTDVFPLGDRVEVHAIEIVDDKIVIPMKTHKPVDPMCCPSEEVIKRFTVQENRLVPASGDSSEKSIQKITGTVWRWMEVAYNDDRKIVPADSKNYTVQFLENGTLNVKADCNQKGGTYSVEEKRLSIEITHSTMAACPENSLEDEFVRGLTAAAIYFIKDNDLYIDLIYDTGTMKFSKQKD